MEGNVGPTALLAAVNRAGEDREAPRKERQYSNSQKHLELFSENGRELPRLERSVLQRNNRSPSTILIRLLSAHRS